MRDKVKLNVYSFITVFLWAAAFPLTKVVAAEFNPYSLGFMRCIVASLSLLIISKFISIKKPASKKDLALFIIAGICGFALYLIFFNTGILTITSATSSVIIASTPIMTAIVCNILYKERIARSGWISIALAFIGVAILLFWKGALSINTGILWTLLAAIVFCIYNVINRKLVSNGYNSIEIVLYGMIFASIVLLPSLPMTVSELSEMIHTMSSDSHILSVSVDDLVLILIVIALGIFPSATSYVLWAKAMELADRTNEVTNYMFVTPLLSAIMGFIILGELPDLGTIIGGTIIIAGVILFNISGARSQTN